MEVEFIARSEEKGELEISKRIVRVETIKADEQAVRDLQEVIELLKKLGYTIDS